MGYFYVQRDQIMTKDEKNVSVQAEKCGESVLESIKRFFRNQRNWLAELQEAQFDRGER
jgi:hypothetical protein